MSNVPLFHLIRRVYEKTRTYETEITFFRIFA